MGKDGLEGQAKGARGRGSRASTETTQKKEEDEDDKFAGLVEATVTLQKLVLNKPSTAETGRAPLGYIPLSQLIGLPNKVSRRGRGLQQGHKGHNELWIGRPTRPQDHCLH